MYAYFYGTYFYVGRHSTVAEKLSIQYNKNLAGKKAKNIMIGFAMPLTDWAGLGRFGAQMVDEIGTLRRCEYVKMQRPTKKMSNS